MAAKKEFLLRIDPGLWNELQAWAADELRSVNGQIEYILRTAIMKRRGNKDTGAATEHNPPEPPNNLLRCSPQFSPPMNTDTHRCEPNRQPLRSARPLRRASSGLAPSFAAALRSETRCLSLPPP